MSQFLRTAAVLKGNRDLHRLEAPYYDRLHPEIWNAYEQSLVRKDLAHIRHLVAHPPLRVLDVGCGTGNLALKFMEAGDHVDGVDLSPEMLGELRRKQPENERLCLFAVDADTFLNTAERYDVICFSSVLHHLPDYYATLARCAQLLTSGGVLYVTHEPLPKAIRLQSAPIQNALTRLGWKVRGAWRRMTRQRFPRLDYTLSDVHVEAGIGPEGLLESLEVLHLQTVFVRCYRAEPLAVVAWINNTLAGWRPQLFAFAAQKRR